LGVVFLLTTSADAASVDRGGRHSNCGKIVERKKTFSTGKKKKNLPDLHRNTALPIGFYEF
jgi:hypothetical protein